MKSQILQLEPYDDAISTRDKMGWDKTGRILLVWPERGRVLTRRLDLVLVQRRSRALGAQLALVTRDPLVRFHAYQLGLPAFRSLGRAQQSAWRAPRRQRRPPTAVLPAGPTFPRPDFTALREQAHPGLPAWMGRPLARLGFFTLGVLALLAIAAVLLPSAEIHLTPETRTQEVALQVQADRQANQVSLSGIVPARPVTVEVEGRQETASSGSAGIPSETASGQVMFTNLTGNKISLPQGSVIRSSGSDAVRFSTTRPVDIAAVPGITVTVSVQALTPGTAGNLPAGKLGTLEGPLEFSLAVTNPQPTRGGSDRTAPAPTAEDYTRLDNQLVELLRKSALEELESGLKSGDLLLSASPALSQVIEKKVDPPQSQPSDRLAVSARLEFQALVVSGEDLRSLGASILDANLPQGFQPISGTLEIRNSTGANPASSDLTRWRFTAKRKLQASLPENEIIQLALGLSRSSISPRLSSALPLAAPPRITLHPSWWPRLPFLPFRIRVIRD
jgi:hypothetical protein